MKLTDQNAIRRWVRIEKNLGAALAYLCEMEGMTTEQALNEALREYYNRKKANHPNGPTVPDIEP